MYMYIPLQRIKNIYTINIYIHITNKKNYMLLLENFCIYVKRLEFTKQNRKEEETEQQQQTYQFTQGYNILHRLQVHHLTLTYIIHNTILHTYCMWQYLGKGPMSSIFQNRVIATIGKSSFELQNALHI